MRHREDPVEKRFSLYKAHLHSPPKRFIDDDGDGNDANNNNNNNNNNPGNATSTVPYEKPRPRSRKRSREPKRLNDINIQVRLFAVSCFVFLFLKSWKRSTSQRGNKTQTSEVPWKLLFGNRIWDILTKKKHLLFECYLMKWPQAYFLCNSYFEYSVQCHLILDIRFRSM